MFIQAAGDLRMVSGVRLPVFFILTRAFLLRGKKIDNNNAIGLKRWYESTC